MRLRLLAPARILVDEEVGSVTAEGREGSFGILPRHADYVSALVPGILTFRDRGGRERLAAVDRGILVKHGEQVTVSVRDAVPGDSLEALRDTVEARFQRLDERERRARSALARLETGFMRRFAEQLRRDPG